MVTMPRDNLFQISTIFEIGEIIAQKTQFQIRFLILVALELELVDVVVVANILGLVFELMELKMTLGLE